MVFVVNPQAAAESSGFESTILEMVDTPVSLNTRWQDSAMCSGKTDIFFPMPGERDGRRRRREALARSYCACCPVADPCREAGRQGREHGLWGSENDEQRAAAGYAARSPHRRAVAVAARQARREELGRDDTSEVA